MNHEQRQDDQFEQPQAALPDMELVQLIEGMSQEERVELKRQCLDKISNCEMVARMIDDANAAEGLADVEIIH